MKPYTFFFIFFFWDLNIFLNRCNFFDIIFLIKNISVITIRGTQPPIPHLGPAPLHTLKVAPSGADTIPHLGPIIMIHPGGDLIKADTNPNYIC